MIPSCCTEQGFESEHLGKPVWRLEDVDQAAEAVRLAQDHNVGLLYCRSDVPLQSLGFRHVETLMTFEGAIPTDPTATADIRKAEATDTEAILSIAETAFTFDRWHSDETIPDQAANRFKSAWMKNNLSGRADCVIVAVSEAGDVQGFNALFCRPPYLIIDLIAVAGTARGQGVGCRLIAGALQRGREAGLNHLRVGTQSRNTASLKLYRSSGLRDVSRIKTWHWTQL